MKNILTTILVFGFFSFLFLQKYYEEKIETNHLEKQSIIDSLHNQIDSLHYDMNILPKEHFMPYMTECLAFIFENVDDTINDLVQTASQKLDDV